MKHGENGVRPRGVGKRALRDCVKGPTSDASADIELRWRGKDRTLTVDDQFGYEWTDDAVAAPTTPRTLKERLRVGDVDTDAPNLLIRGDALEALACLADIPALAGSVRLCYIDPPFNRGEAFAHYDDGLERGMWMSMLRDRLHAIRGVLAEDGSVWVHLDDAAQHHGRCLLDETFGADSFVATVIWQRRTSRDNRTAFSAMHDYIHVYAPAGPKLWKRKRNALPDDGAFVNPDDDPRGPWRSVPLTAQAGHATPQQFYTVVSPTGVRHDPPPGRCWTYTRERFESLLASGRVYWPRGGAGKPRLKRYRDEVEGLAPSTLWLAEEVGENAHAKKDMLALFDDRAAFDTPKPERLLERIVQIATNAGDLVLDCFLGSGTTAAVAHKMGRRWIGIERSKIVFDRFSLPRLRAVVAGDDGVGVSTRLEWNGGGGFIVADLTPADESTTPRTRLSA